jgi:hypothetical protein
LRRNKKQESKQKSKKKFGFSVTKFKFKFGMKNYKNIDETGKKQRKRKIKVKTDMKGTYWSVIAPEIMKGVDVIADKIIWYFDWMIKFISHGIKKKKKKKMS